MRPPNKELILVVVVGRGRGCEGASKKKRDGRHSGGEEKQVEERGKVGVGERIRFF